MPELRRHDAGRRPAARAGPTRSTNPARPAHPAPPAGDRDPTGPPSALLALQQTAGNAAVSGLVTRRRATPSGAAGIAGGGLHVQRDGADAPPSAAPARSQVLIWAGEGKWTEVARYLDKRDNMLAIVNNLDDLHAAGLLDQFEARIDTIEGVARSRLWAAALTVGPHILGERWKEHVETLSEADFEALKMHVVGRLNRGEVRMAGALRRARDGQPFIARPEMSNTDWLKEFLQFFGFGPPEKADPNGQSATFDGATRTRPYILDMISEQGAREGRLLGPDDVDPVAKLFTPEWTRPAPAPGAAPGAAPRAEPDPALAFQVTATQAAAQTALSSSTGRFGVLWQPNVALGPNVLLHRKGTGLEIGIFGQAGGSFNIRTLDEKQAGERSPGGDWALQLYIQPVWVAYVKRDKTSTAFLRPDQVSLVTQGGLGHALSRKGDTEGSVLVGPQVTWNIRGDWAQVTAAAGAGWSWPIPVRQPGNFILGLNIGFQFVLPLVKYKPKDTR